MQLLQIQNRLVIVIGNSRYSFPTGYAFESGIVKIWSLDDTTIEFKYPLHQISNQDGAVFSNIGELEDFLTPLLGFNTASGGSEVGEGSFQTVNGIAVTAEATGNGKALKAKSNLGLSAHMVGQQLIEQTDTNVYTDDAIFEVNATSYGSLPCPRVTTSQKNNINVRTPGLMVYDINFGRYEVWNGSYWAGSRQTVNIFHGEWSSPANGQTYAFGAMPIAPQTSGGFPVFDIIARGSGVVRACTFNLWYSGTGGTGEAISLYIRHNTTDYLVATVASNAYLKIFENALMNIPYVDRDRFKMIIVNPASGTRGRQLLGQGTYTTE